MSCECGERVCVSCAAGRRTGGFTLIEVLMAAFVLGLGVLGLAAMFAGAARQQQLSSQVSLSTSLSQSAQALVDDRIGKIGGSNCDPFGSANFYPGQTLYKGQWYVVPVKIEATDQSINYLSVNPEQNWSTGDSLYFRLAPTQALPRLMYRADTTGGLVTVGATGENGINAAPFNTGAPSFDPSFHAVRVLSDSVVIRVVTTGYLCDEGLQRRGVDDRGRREIVYTLEPSIDCPDGPSIWGFPAEEHPLVSDGSYIVIDQQRTVSDEAFNANPSTEASTITEMFIGDVWGGLALEGSDVNCDGFTDYIEVTPGNGVPIYNDGNFNQAGPDRFEAFTINGQPYYQYRTDGLSADLRNPIDPRPEAQNVYYRSGQGPYTLTPNGAPVGEVAEINSSWRFVSEIWLDSFEYRGHRIVSADNRIWRTPDPDSPTGYRPVVAYSLLYRDLGSEGGAQYVVFTYALRSSSARAEYVPPEEKTHITAGDSPIKRVPLKLGYDDELLRHYVVIPRSDEDVWVTNPGQILMFMGDGGASPDPIRGADGPVKVLFLRDDGGNRRGYLEGPPRSGVVALESGLPGSEVDYEVWAVQPSVVSEADGSEWGLRPIEARVFEIFEN